MENNEAGAVSYAQHDAVPHFRNYAMDYGAQHGMTLYEIVGILQHVQNQLLGAVDMLNRGEE